MGMIDLALVFLKPTPHVRRHISRIERARQGVTQHRGDTVVARHHHETIPFPYIIDIVIRIGRHGTQAAPLSRIHQPKIGSRGRA